MKNSIVLIGMPGCGKTTIGEKVSKKLNKELVDIDDFMEYYNNDTVGNILSNLGEENFLEFEKKMSFKINPENKIISTTGSNPLKSEVMNFFKDYGTCIFLDIPLEDIKQRLHEMKVDRIVGMGRMNMDEILNYRYEFYNKNCDYRFRPKSSNSSEEITDELISFIYSYSILTSFKTKEKIQN